MLGRASYMRLPDIVGVELTGERQPGITATDIVLALTEFLRNEGVVSTYLELFGRRFSIDPWGPSNHLQYDSEFGATAAMFYIDQHTLDYLRLTGREEHQVQLVENYAKRTGLWADAMADADYERVLRFDLSSVCRNIAGPSNPHRRVPTSELAAQGISGEVEQNEGKCLMGR